MEPSDFGKVAVAMPVAESAPAKEVDEEVAVVALSSESVLPELSAV
jgi:hypothetical protein